MSRYILPAVAVALALGCSDAWLAQVHGEVFVLASGGRIEGEYLNPGRTAGEAYELRTAEGVRLALSDRTVQRVVVKTNLDKQYEALLPKVPNTADGQWSMAEWCKEAGLLDERKRHLQAVIALDPEHVEARKALGYQRYGSRWLTQEDYMVSQGYQRYKGAWRLKQEIEIEMRDAQHELAAKQLRKDIRRWFEQLSSGGRHADTADRELNAIRDPNAAAGLSDILSDAHQPLAVRQRSLAILAKLPPGLATGVYVRLAMNDPDGNIRNACLDELKREGAHVALSAFLSELKSRDNARVNRAAECLERLEATEATLPLINALVTEHRFQINPGSGPGSMSTTFSPGGSGPGGMSMGGRPIYVKRQLQNPRVRDALTVLHPGVNYQYDIPAWRSWYSSSQSTGEIDLRRDQ